MRSGSITVLRTVRLNRGSNGSLHFWHRPVLEHKRTVMVRGSRFFRSDRTVRSGFQNIGFHKSFPKVCLTQKQHLCNMVIFQKSHYKLLTSAVHSKFTSTGHRIQPIKLLVPSPSTLEPRNTSIKPINNKAYYKNYAIKFVSINRKGFPQKSNLRL